MLIAIHGGLDREAAFELPEVGVETFPLGRRPILHARRGPRRMQR